MVCARDRTLVAFPVQTLNTKALVLAARIARRSAQTASFDKSEIAGLLAITKNLDGIAAKEPVGENRDYAGIWGQRILPRSIKVEEAQSDCRHSMYRAGDAGVEFASILIGAVCTERRCGALLVDREATAIPINRGSRGVDNRDLSMATRRSCLIENVNRAGEIDLMGAEPVNM